MSTAQLGGSAAAPGGEGHDITQDSTVHKQPQTKRVAHIQPHHQAHGINSHSDTVMRTAPVWRTKNNRYSTKWRHRHGTSTGLKERMQMGTKQERCVECIT
jgi:hypothetical protein